MPKSYHKPRREAGVIKFGEPRKFNPYSLHMPRIPTKEEEASALIQQLMLTGDFKNALRLYIGLIEASRYSIGNLWELGVELVGRVDPTRLTEFLYAVYINSPPKHRVIVFDTYIQNLMIEERWLEAKDELEIRCSRPKYQQPVLLNKLKICRQKVNENRQKLEEERLKKNE